MPCLIFVLLTSLRVDRQQLPDRYTALLYPLPSRPPMVDVIQVTAVVGENNDGVNELTAVVGDIKKAVPDVGDVIEAKFDTGDAIEAVSDNEDVTKPAIDDVKDVAVMDCGKDEEVMEAVSTGGNEVSIEQGGGGGGR